MEQPPYLLLPTQPQTITRQRAKQALMQAASDDLSHLAGLVPRRLRRQLARTQAKLGLALTRPSKLHLLNSTRIAAVPPHLEAEYRRLATQLATAVGAAGNTL